MTRLVRYLAADVVRGQRFLAPVLVYCAVLGMMFSSDAGPALQSYAGSCALIYPVAAWLAVVIATSEDQVRRDITVVTAGGWPPVLRAVAALCLVWIAAMSLLATAWPLVTNPHPYRVADVATGFAAHLVSGALGVAVGLALARPVLRSIGHTVLAVFAVVVATFVVGDSSPLGWMLTMLNKQVITTALLWSALSAAVLVAAAVVVAAKGRFPGRRSALSANRTYLTSLRSSSTSFGSKPRNRVSASS